MQIVLYVGGIMVLFLFVIMLVNLDEAAKERQFNRQWLDRARRGGRGRRARSATSCTTARTAFQFAARRRASAVRRRGQHRSRSPTRCFSEYLLPFEIASMLLLVAVVGSVVMAKKRI